MFPPGLGSPTSSYLFYHDAPILPTKVLNDFWCFYDPGVNAGSLDCSPLLADEFLDFPPTYVSVAGCDPLRDQGYEYAKKMEAAGVNVKFDVMPGYPHGMSSHQFLRLNSLMLVGHTMWPQLKGWSDALQMFIDGVNWGIEQAKLKNQFHDI